MGNINDNVQNAKAWYKSKTIIGVILTFVPTIVRLINPEWTLDLEGVIEEGFTGAEAIANTADQIWVQVTELIGVAVAIWGRITAKVSLKKSIV